MYSVRQKNMKIFNIQLFLIYRVQQNNLMIFNFFVFHIQGPAKKPDEF